MACVRVGELELFYDTDGAGEPVLLLMGLGGEHHAWDLVRPDLARRYRLVLVDNRDAGASSEARGAYTLDDMAGAAPPATDALASESLPHVRAAPAAAVSHTLV